MAYRVLIVDDQKDVSRLLRSALETIEHGLEVIEAPSGEEAILESTRKKVDLLISDFRLPGITGVELMRKFRARNPDVKIILITGVSDTRSLKEINEAKADAYFAKPVPIGDFLDAVERTLGLARTILHTPTPAETPEEPERNTVGDLLITLRKDLDASAVLLLNGGSGQVEAEAGTVPDPNTASSLIAALMGMYNASQKAASMIDRHARPQHLFIHGEKNDGVFLPVGTTHAIFVAGPRLTSTGNLPKTLERLSQAELEILDELEKIGVVIEEEPAVPGGTPAYIEPFTQPENLSREFMQIFDQVGKKSKDANSFWDTAVEKGTTFDQPDKLTYEQAARLGLAPGADDKKDKKE